MRRLVFTTLAGLAAFGLVAGFAASLPMSSDQLGANSATVAACQPTGTPINVSFGVSGINVSEVMLSDVDGSCAGQAYQMNLAGTTLGVLSGTVSLSDLDGDTAADDMKVVLSSTVAAASVTGVELSITGVDATP